MDADPKAHSETALRDWKARAEQRAGHAIGRARASVPIERMREGVATSPEQHMDPRQSTIFFHERMCAAFPGVRGLQAFAGDDAIARLGVLLRDPLTDAKYSPTWQLWDIGSMPVATFASLGSGLVRLDHYRYRLVGVSAFVARAYWQSFVAIHWAADEPTGLYGDMGDIVQEATEANAYLPEEYARWGDRPITREEYDDGAVFEHGVSREATGARLEVRQLTKGMSFLCAQLSALHNPPFDLARCSAVRALMDGPLSLEEFSEQVGHLPRHRRDDD